MWLALSYPNIRFSSNIVPLYFFSIFILIQLVITASHLYSLKRLGLCSLRYEATNMSLYNARKLVIFAPWVVIVVIKW